MKLTKKLLFILPVLYFAFIIVTMQKFEVTPDSFEYTGRFISEKNKIIRNLSDEYNAVIASESFENFTAYLQSYILKNNVILDSTILGAYREKDKYYVRLSIEAEGKNILAKLKCNEDLYERINDFHFSEAIVVADITSIRTRQTPVELVLDDHLVHSFIGEDILLAGRCLESIELAPFAL